MSESHDISESSEVATGQKRPAETSVSNSPKRNKGQTTIEQSLEAQKHSAEPELKKEDFKEEAEQGSGSVARGEPDNDSRGKDDEMLEKDSQKVEEDAVAISPTREDAAPSSILEHGIIYFFFRGRVGVDEPEDVGDLARSYIVMRSLPTGAKLGDGPISDSGNCRLLALPKKVLPTSERDKFMVFVEKSGVSVEELKQDFISGSDYTTKSSGSRHAPAATPAGEGVYAITRTGRDSHLAYILTVPAELGEVQKDIGLRERGSFIVSLKNPEAKGPSNAQLDASPGYPKELQEKFRGLRWMPLEPEYLNYTSTQVLFIGEGQGSLEKATEIQSKDQEQGKDDPLKQIEDLEHEDEIRVQHLDAQGKDAIFADLRLHVVEYPKVQTTW